MVLHRERGFTLIDTAVVVVILGCLMSGVLKAQELIQSARVRALIAQQQDIKAAYYAFYDRYKALPGDYSAASTNINCGATACLDGDGDGRINSSAGGSANGNNGGANGNHGNGNNGNGNGNYTNNGNNGNHGGGGQSGVVNEALLAWAHLSAAGFLKGNFALASASVSVPDDSNSPKNPYGAYLQIGFDSACGSNTNPVSSHNIKTGNLIPVALLAEIDRKVDDGCPGSGHFQFSTYAGAGMAPDIGGTDPQSCTTRDDQTATWNEVGGQTNCGAASLL